MENKNSLIYGLVLKAVSILDRPVPFDLIESQISFLTGDKKIHISEFYQILEELEDKGVIVCEQHYQMKNKKQIKVIV